MFKSKNDIDARFFRVGTSAYVGISLFGTKKFTPVCQCNILYHTRLLGDMELKRIIRVLSSKKEAMEKQHNFPPIYDEMLTDLISVLNERYKEQLNKVK